MRGTVSHNHKGSGVWRTFRKQKIPQTFAILGIIYLLVFSYVPMSGLVMAFKNYNISLGVMGIFTSDWVGLKHFKAFVNDINFWTIIRNTVALSFLKLIFAFPMPIIFAVMLNEIKQNKIKRCIQTISYLPHFISWVIVSGLAINFLATDNGLINQLLISLGLVKEGIPFLTSAGHFWPLAVVLDVWKDMGWWTIIFLAAITGIDPSLYEAADIDGASRFSKILKITIPGIRGTIAVVLILALGNLFGGGLSGSNFEQSYLLGNAMNLEKSQIIQTYIFKVGLSNGRYAYATAIGLIQSVISLVLIFGSNLVSKKVSDTSLF